MTCLVNPELGREGEGLVQPAARPKRILVAGAGPAGLTAAWTAARRGHEVSLCEREAHPGGLYNLASVGEGKQELARVIQYLAGQAERSGVRLQTGQEADASLLAREAPEELIVATGGEPCADLAGAGGPNLLFAADVLAGKVPRPSGRVLVAGGGMVGCETAELLACPGFQRTEVLVVEKRQEPAQDMWHEARVLLLERLAARGVRILTGVRLRELTTDGAVVEREGPEGHPGRQERLAGFDWIVLALGARPRDALSEGARQRGIEVRTVGDARQPRRALEATAEGFAAGREV
jgi:NADPH-dependent 2,4-dienoyl-CoA reductase/sulfur reductase-like enzyme